MSLKRDWLSKVRSFSTIASYSKDDMISISLSLRIYFWDEPHRIFLLSSSRNKLLFSNCLESALSSLNKSLIEKEKLRVEPPYEGGISILVDGILTYECEESGFHQGAGAIRAPYRGSFTGGYLIQTPSSLFRVYEGTPDSLLMKFSYEGSLSLAGVNVSASPFYLTGKKALSCLSDRGLMRPNNEDSCLSSTIEISSGEERRRYHVLCVADGVGGAGYGEVASRDAILEAYKSLVIDLIESDNIEGIVRSSVVNANLKVLEDKAKMGEMGTTFTLALIRRGDLVVGHVGDSRAYIIDSAGIRQITKDHKYVDELVERGLITREQARYHPQRNIITSALGMSNPRIDLESFKGVINGNSLLVTTDGLTDLVDDYYIYETFMRYPNHPDLLARILVKQANNRGGKDNISVAMLTNI